ncbi:MAG TPA: SGNH/GDSL hydrolase family protein, partial [Tepidisphaeraceae bacterium]
MRTQIGIVALITATASPLWGFSGLLSFGDSLSDVGNTYGATFGLSPGGSPYYNGRYSNGPVWVEDLALDQALAVPTLSRSGGLDYAYGGAETGTGNTSLVIWNLQKQVSTYLGNHTPSPTQLVTLWAGANDFFDGQTNVATPVNNIATSIGSLATAGAKTFLVPNLPLLGDTP